MPGMAVMISTEQYERLRTIWTARTGHEPRLETRQMYDEEIILAPGEAPEGEAFFREFFPGFFREYRPADALVGVGRR